MCLMSRVAIVIAIGYSLRIDNGCNFDHKCAVGRLQRMFPISNDQHPDSIQRGLRASLGISSKGLNERLRRAYGLLDIFQNVLLVLSVAVFAVWVTGKGISYLYACLALFIAGVMPPMIRSFHFFSPPKKAPIIQETVAKSRNFPWTEATAVLSFLAGVLELVKALVAFAW